MSALILNQISSTFYNCWGTKFAIFSLGDTMDFIYNNFFSTDDTSSFNQATTKREPSNVGSLSRSRTFLKALIVMAHISIVSRTSQAYVITMDAGIDNECFHERVPVGTKLGYSFEVIEGGFFDIDIEIKDPNNMLLHQEERSSSGKFTIEASIEGPYQLCFNNKRTSFAPKVIMFEIDKSGPSNTLSSPSDGSQNAGDGKDDNDVGKLHKMVDQLMMTTISATHDVRYLRARDKVHRKVSERTNRTIMYWSGLEFVLLMLVSVGQVIYVRRFFEIRRKT